MTAATPTGTTKRKYHMHNLKTHETAAYGAVMSDRRAMQRNRQFKADCSVWRWSYNEEAELEETATTETEEWCGNCKHKATPETEGPCKACVDGAASIGMWEAVAVVADIAADVCKTCGGENYVCSICPECGQ